MADAPKGTPANRNVFGDDDPDDLFPNGCVRSYNEDGQPIGLDRKPGNEAHTHIPKNPDGSYPAPHAWNP